MRGGAIDRERLALLEVAQGMPEDFRAATLAGLRRLVGFDSALFLPFDEHFLEVVPRHMRAWGSSPRYQEGMERIYDPRLHGTYVDTELFSPGERDRLPLFRELMYPIGLTSTMCSAVRFRGRASGVIHLYRHDRSRPFSTAERERALPLIDCVGLLHAAFGATSPPPAILDRLTSRERQVAGLVANGFQNQQIAAQLGRSPHTIRHQLESIFSKCGIFSRTDLALLVRGGPSSIDVFDDERTRLRGTLDRVQRLARTLDLA